MKNSAIFVISALLVGALAVAAYTMSNSPVSSEAEANQQAAADALNSTEPAAGAMDDAAAVPASEPTGIPVTGEVSPAVSDSPSADAPVVSDEPSKVPAAPEGQPSASEQVPAEEVAH